MWFSIVLVAITLYIVQNYYDSIRGLFLTWNTIGPPSFPIIGSALCFLNKTSAGTSKIRTSGHLYNSLTKNNNLSQNIFVGNIRRDLSNWCRFCESVWFLFQILAWTRIKIYNPRSKRYRGE